MSLRAGAQEGVVNVSPILFRGVVFDAVTEKPVEGVQYFSERAAATNAEGLFSFYAHVHDTVIFEKEGYRSLLFLISDTLKAREYTMGIFMNPDTLYISEVVIIPRMRDLRTEVLLNPPSQSTEQTNASNNLRLSAYQSMAGMNQLGSPDANYQAIKQQQKIDAFEKGGIPSDKMVSLSPFTLIPAVYLLMHGLPQTPEPPAPFLSSRELQDILKIHNISADTIRQKPR